jgi:hypothetical protein
VNAVHAAQPREANAPDRWQAVTSRMGGRGVGR